MTLGVALACLLCLGILAYVLLPILREATGQLPATSTDRSELEDLYIQREGTYATLKELDFDHETGKLTEEDYRELRARYSAEAVRILQRIDELEASSAEGPALRTRRHAPGDHTGAEAGSTTGKRR